jgi:hypothetical protein
MIIFLSRINNKLSNEIPIMIEYENLREANHSFFEEYKQSFNTALESSWFIPGNAVKTFIVTMCGIRSAMN